MYGVAAVLNIETSSYVVLLHWHQGNIPVYGKPERVVKIYILWNGLLSGVAAALNLSLKPPAPQLLEPQHTFFIFF